MGDGVVYCFLRWMSLQSNKILIISSMCMERNLTDKKSNKVKETVSTKHLILIPICQNNHWIIYFIIRSSKNSFMLILMDSLNTGEHTYFTNIIINWFESSEDVKQKNITLSLETIDLPVSVCQTDVHSCASFVCVYSYVESCLSTIIYSTKNKWLASFNVQIIKHINAERPIHDFKKDLKMFCLLSKNKDCVVDLQETLEPERFFLDNFIPMSTLESSLLLQIESVTNGDTVIEVKEHENKYNKTKKLYSALKNHVGSVDCECSMEEWYLKDIVSKLTIEFLINYDSDKLHIFPDFVCWGCLYTTIEDVMDEMEDEVVYEIELDEDFDETGVLGVLPGIIGVYQANEVLKIIQRCNYIIGNESGPICIGAALRKKVLSIYNPLTTPKSSKIIYNKIKYINSRNVNSKSIQKKILKFLN